MTRLILILTLFSLSTFTYGQTFAPLGAKWYYSASAGGMAPTGSEYYLYESQKDTIVSGQSCKKLTVTYYKYLNGDTAYLPPVFVYQSTDTVYYYNTIYSKYFPLYIFNVLQGDTLTFHSPDIPFNPADTLWKAVVDTVTTFVIGTDTLKRIWTHTWSAYSFWGSYIEKLGCDFLMLHQPSGIYPEWDGPMRCYSDSNIYYNFNTFLCDYRLISSINKIENFYRLSIFPNPTSSELNIESYEQKKIHYRIYNTFGQLVKEGATNSSLTTIFIGSLSNGLYNILFSTIDRTERKCFIIQK